MSRPPPTTAPPGKRNKAQKQTQSQQQQPPPPQQSTRQPSAAASGAGPHRTSSPQVGWPPNSHNPAGGGSFSSPSFPTSARSGSERPPHPAEPTLGSMGGYGGPGGNYMPHGSLPPISASSFGAGAYSDDRGSPHQFGHSQAGAPPGSSMFRSSHPASFAPGLPSGGYPRPQYQQTHQLPPPHIPERRQSTISMLYDSPLAGPSSLPQQVAPQRAAAQRKSSAPPARTPEKQEDEDDDDDEDMGDDVSLRAGGGGRKGGIEDEDEEGALVAIPGNTATGKKRRPHATRRRVVQSCSECRRRKIKCDKKFPCTPCLLRDDQAQCHEVGMAEKNVIATPFTFATASDLASVAQRLDALEAALTKTGALVPSDLDQYLRRAQRLESISYPAGGGPAFPGESLTGITAGPVIKAEDTATGEIVGGDQYDSPIAMEAPDASATQQPTSAALALPSEAQAGQGNGESSRSTMAPPPAEDDADGDMDPQDDTEGAALTLEHLAFGRSTVEGAHAIPHFGARAPSAISKHAPNNDYHLVRPHPLPLQGQGMTPPSNAGPGGGRAVSGSMMQTGSGDNSPAEMRRKSSLMQPPSHGSGNSVPGAGETKRRDTLPGGSGTGSYGETLSEEDRAMRIDGLLDLIGPMDIFTLFYRKTDVGLRALVKVLPDRERGELLVKTFLEKVDWLHRCLHVPTFLRQCHDLWAIPLDMVVHDIALPFVALYYSVCCLGIQFMDTDEARKYFTNEEIRDLPDLYFNAARSCMWAADFIGRHAVENLQCLLLLSVFMNNRDRGEAAWALLGAAIKMAQGLGLSRLGAEPTSTDAVKSSPMWTGRWESVIEREVGRRIWWNLVFLDWALSPSYNFSCSIQPDQIKTALPANIDDEDIIDGQILRPQPPHVRTQMSFVLARIKFIQIMYRQICEANIHRHPPYPFILSVDAELRKAMMELPLFFQPNSPDGASSVTDHSADVETDGDNVRSTPPPIDHNPKSLIRYYEKVMLNLAIHSRMLRLHRPWLSRGYTDERFAYSKEQCIRAARASLRLMGDTHGTAAFLEKWWLPLFYVSVSGLVVIIDLLRTNRKDMHSRETEQKIREVRGALDQMRQIADVSHPSRSAVKVMEFLLAEVEERRRPPGAASAVTGKRKTPDDDEADGLQRAVKKLIRQAQLETDSPVTSTTTMPATTPTSNSAHSHASVSPHHDPARDRPVFDAYPLLPSTATLQPRADESAASAPTPGGGKKGNLNPGFSLLDFNFDTPPSNPSASVPLPRAPARSASGSLPNPSNQYPPPPGSAQGYRPNPNQASASPFPFQLDFDPSGNPFLGPFPTFHPDTYTPNAHQLDPSVEDLLANYFPTPQQQQQNAPNGTNVDMTGGQGWGTVPDDFLSRVFSFSWETTPGGGAGDVQGQQPGAGRAGGPQGATRAPAQNPGQQAQGQGQVAGGSRQRQQSQSLGQGQGLQGQPVRPGNGAQGVSAQGFGSGGDFVPFDWGTSSGGWMA